MPTVREYLEVVLIVEDDADDAYLLARQMKGLEEIGEVLVLDAAPAALAELRSRAGTDTAATLILLDVNMPGMNGFEFLDALEASDEAGDHEASVIVVTNSASDPDRLRALENPRVLDYIVKPASRRDVLNVLRTAARDV